MKNQLSIKQRIYRVVYAVVGTSLLTSISFFATQFFIGNFVEDSDKALQGLRVVNRAETFYFQSLSGFRAYLLTPTQKKYRQDFDEATVKAREFIGQAEEGNTNPVMKELISEVRKADTAVEAIAGKVMAAAENGDRQMMEKLYTTEHTPAFDKLEAAMESTRKEFVKQRDAAIASRDRAKMIGNMVMLVILISSSVLIAIYSIRLAKSVSQSLEKISEDLGTSASAVQEASSSVSTASQALSESTTQQAAAIEETVSSMEEMSSMLSQTSQNTVTTLNLAEEGRQEGERGKTVISKMLTAMDEIHASNGRLESIVNLIEEIKSKTKVINDIVFETRLLSFNASIEAARAGAHGKGFAVVAEEVGKLATMSGKAAEEIRTLLESSTAEVSSVVRGTQERVNSGREISQDCQVVFDTLSHSLEKISESVRMINAATKEQEQGVKQTNQAMAEMDQVTQRNSSSSEALAGQASHLTLGASNMMGSIQDLRSVIFGEAGNSSYQAKPTAVRKVSHFEKESPVKAPTKSEETLPLEESDKVVPLKPGKATASAAVKQQELDRTDSRWKVS